jgi:hypothetical protein
VVQFLFSLLRIKCLYIFRALLAHPQEALHKRHLVYCVRVMSVGCTRVAVFHSNPGAVKFPPRTGHEEPEGKYSFFNLGVKCGWVVNATPRPLYPRGKTRYPLYGRLGEPQGRSGRVRKISRPPGFDIRTVQPVTSRYTDCASHPGPQTVKGSV